MSVDQQAALVDWWLEYKRGAKLPTWDLVISALDAAARKTLILVEAKAHASELSIAGKPAPMRERPDQQERSEKNHARIARAIAEANTALRDNVPGISLNRDISYQLANRITFAWKIASLGIPVALIYLGFIGDKAIAPDADCLRVATDWKYVFDLHSVAHFPCNRQSHKIDCGPASFWLLVHHLPVLRQSPPIDQRRILG